MSLILRWSSTTATTNATSRKPWSIFSLSIRSHALICSFLIASSSINTSLSSLQSPLKRVQNSSFFPLIIFLWFIIKYKLHHIFSNKSCNTRTSFDFSYHVCKMFFQLSNYTCYYCLTKFTLYGVFTSTLHNVSKMSTWRWEKHKKGGLNCVCFFFVSPTDITVQKQQTSSFWSSDQRLNMQRIKTE